MRGGNLVQRAVLGVTVAVIAYLALVPLYFLLAETFFPDGAFSLDGFRRAFSAEGAGDLVANSFIFAIGATFVAVTVGTALAYLFARTDAPFKRLALVASVVPIIIPGVLNAILWIFIASPRIGLISEPLTRLGLENVVDVFSMQGMIFVQGTHLVPLVFLLMIAVFRSMDPALEEAALLSGARYSRLLRRVTLPLAAPALLGATVIVMVQTLENLEVPAVLGLQDRIFVFTSRIFFLARRFPPDNAAMGAISLTVVVLAGLGIALSNRLSGAGRQVETITGKGFRPRTIELSKRARRLSGAFIVGYFSVAVVLPLVALVYASLLRFFRPPSRDAFGEFSLENYRTILSDDRTTTAWRNTALVASVTAVILTLLAAVAAWLIVRSSSRGRHVVDQLAMFPLAVPGLILGLALVFAYLRLPGGVYGTLVILVIAYVTRFLPYGMRYALASMRQVGLELEESAAMSGATWWVTMRRVVLPLVAPGLLSGFIFIVVISFREFSASILLYNPGNEVLSIRIFQMMEDGQLPLIAALGVLLVSSLTIVTLLAYRLGSRVGIRLDQ